MNINDYALILANDITESEKALKLCEETAPYLDALKIGITSSLEDGISFFRKLSERVSIPKVGDFKVADIGFKNKTTNQWEGTNEKIVRKLVEAGTDYVICHTIVGTSSIQECVETAHKLGGKVLTLPYMTHEGAELFFDQPINVSFTVDKLENKLGLKIAPKVIEEIEKRKKKEDNWRLPYVSISDLILAIGDDVGVDGYIGPANNPSVLADYRKITQTPTFTPGIGRQKKEEDITPQQQIFNVFDKLGSKCGIIVGSAIYGSKEPKKAAEEFRTFRDEAKASYVFSRGC
jgi:orotidine-5'-phosphate decarboxylase